MGKVNVYLPDELEQAVRSAGISISAVCQMAVSEVLTAMRTIEVAAPGDGTLRTFLAVATRLTPRLRDILGGLADRGGAPVTAQDLLEAVVVHRDNLGAQILRDLGVDLPLAQPPRRAGAVGDRDRAGGGALAGDARALLAGALRVAIEMRHNYVGAEHLVIASAAEASPLHPMFARIGVEQAQLRRAAERLLADRVAARGGGEHDVSSEVARLRAEVDALVARVDRIERGERPRAGTR